MKNIRNYDAPKYKGEAYKEVESGIYATTADESESADYLALEQLMVPEELKEIENLDGWVRGEELYEDFLVLTHNGKNYYKDPEDPDELILIDHKGNDEIYVTSLIFEQEPEFEENAPTDEEISQYPLEDIFDKFYCYGGDLYPEENAKDPVNSYYEFVSDDLEDIRNLRSIIGKHVYNQEDGDIIRLIIE